MEAWERNLKVAAAGVAAAALLEVLTGQHRTRAASLGRCFLAGTVALAYAQFVPAAAWGPRSGAEFAHLPWVRALASGAAGVEPLQRTGWGGLTGLLLRWTRD